MGELRVAALFSGGGTNLGHLFEAIDAGELRARIVGAISSKRGVAGIERAERRGIPVHVVARNELGGGEAFQGAVHEALAALKPDLVVLCGFLSKLTLREYSGRAMNIHPTLIPAFCGLGFYGERVHRAVKLTGATVHFCDDEYDTGPIILQQAVPVLDDDTVSSLAARVQQAEREIYPRAVQLYAEGRLQVRGRRVHIVGEGSLSPS
jgi:phosphoribosylglycinamide formyltransferase 1